MAWEDDEKKELPKLETRQVAGGLFVVMNAYAPVQGFFESSELFPDEADRDNDARRAGPEGDYRKEEG
jgi:hypothetical protein